MPADGKMLGWACHLPLYMMQWRILGILQEYDVKALLSSKALSIRVEKWFLLSRIQWAGRSPLALWEQRGLNVSWRLVYVMPQSSFQVEDFT